MRVPNQTPQFVHWSKDYVEHLRTVHLTLVAVSVAIIIIVMSARPYKPAVAVRELHQIVELKKLWTPQWIHDHGNQQHISVPLPKAMPTSDVSEYEIKLDTTTRLMNAWIGGRDDKKHDFSQAVLLVFPKENWVQVSPEMKRVHLNSFPVTLREFEEWWNEFSQPVEVYFPDGINDYVPFSQWQLTDRQKDGALVIDVHPVETSAPLASITATHLDLLQDRKSDVEFYYTGRAPISVGPKRSANSKPIIVYIPITNLAHIKLSRTNLATFFGNWKAEDFNRCFYDLQQASRDFSSLELEDMMKILDADAGKGAEVFEVLGIKIPVTQVTTWGSLVLLGIQVYLLLFLIQLNGKLRAGDPGWDVPWVGMDQTKFAQRVLFLTLVLLPCIAVAVLGGRAISLIIADFRDLEHWWKLKVSVQQGFVLAGKVLMIAAAFATACVLAARSWKYRPQVVDVEPVFSCPPQVFE